MSKDSKKKGDNQKDLDVNDAQDNTELTDEELADVAGSLGISMGVSNQTIFGGGGFNTASGLTSNTVAGLDLNTASGSFTGKKFGR
jgi:hypothetical protein